MANNTNYVLSILRQLKINKATGYDNIPTRMVKLCANELAVILTELVNSSCTCKIFPNDKTHAEISHLFKKKDDFIKANF